MPVIYCCCLVVLSARKLFVPNFVTYNNKNKKKNDSIFMNLHFLNIEHEF